MSRAFKKLATPGNGVVNDNNETTTDTTGVVGVVTTDCQSCEKLATLDMEKAEMQSEIDRLAAHKENLMAKCDRLQAEARQATEGLHEKEKDCKECERLQATTTALEKEKSRLKAEVERLQSALKQVQSSLDTETAKVKRIESEMDTAKKELTEAVEAQGTPVWLAVVVVITGAALFLLGTWV